MLSITRRAGEKIVITDRSGNEAVIVVTKTGINKTTICFEDPNRFFKFHRAEFYKDSAGAMPIGNKC